MAGCKHRVAVFVLHSAQQRRWDLALGLRDTQHVSLGIVAAGSASAGRMPLFERQLTALYLRLFAFSRLSGKRAIFQMQLLHRALKLSQAARVSDYIIGDF